MLDADYLQCLLAHFEKASYSGVTNTDVGKLMVDRDKDEADEVAKFIYHMDEVWNAGLIRWKDQLVLKRWGLSQSPDGQHTFSSYPLVLTPAGQAFIDELSKTSGMERFKAAMKTTGLAAGAEALKVIVTQLATSVTS